MKSLKNDKKPNPYVRKIVLPIKVNSEEMRKILLHAGAFTKGNVSAWVRYAALNFKPAKGDFQK